MTFQTLLEKLRRHIAIRRESVWTDSLKIHPELARYQSNAARSDEIDRFDAELTKAVQSLNEER